MRVLSLSVAVTIAFAFAAVDRPVAAGITGLRLLQVFIPVVIFGVAAGSLAAGLVVTQVMEFPFVWVAGAATGAAVAALFVTVALGLAGTVRALGRKPAEVLRNL